MVLDMQRIHGCTWQRQGFLFGYHRSSLKVDSERLLSVTAWVPYLEIHFLRPPYLRPLWRVNQRGVDQWWAAWWYFHQLSTHVAVNITRLSHLSVYLYQRRLPWAPFHEGLPQSAILWLLARHLISFQSFSWSCRCLSEVPRHSSRYHFLSWRWRAGKHLALFKISADSSHQYIRVSSACHELSKDHMHNLLLHRLHSSAYFT